MTIKETAKKAIEEGGYEYKGSHDFRFNELEEIIWVSTNGSHIEILRPETFLLDPAFWQALEKAQGWTGMWYVKIGNEKRRHVAEWEAAWLRFIEHLADGKTAE